MGAALNDAPLLQYHDAVGIANGGQPVSDDEGGAALHQGIHTPLHQGFGAGIDGTGGLIQDEHRRVSHSSPGNGQKCAGLGSGWSRRR